MEWRFKGNYTESDNGDFRIYENGKDLRNNYSLYHRDQEVFRGTFLECKIRAQDIVEQHKKNNQTNQK